jgi:hypothetical protein
LKSNVFCSKEEPALYAVPRPTTPPSHPNHHPCLFSLNT